MTSLSAKILSSHWWPSLILPLFAIMTLPYPQPISTSYHNIIFHFFLSQHLLSDVINLYASLCWNACSLGARFKASHAFGINLVPFLGDSHGTSRFCSQMYSSSTHGARHTWSHIRILMPKIPTRTICVFQLPRWGRRCFKIEMMVTSMTLSIS